MVNINATSGQVAVPVVIYSTDRNALYVAFPNKNTQYRNNSYPWSTIAGIKFDWEIE